MTTNSGFDNEQFALSSTDANIPLLAIQAANELDKLIEGRKTTSGSARRLADVLKKSFRLQPVSGPVDSVVAPATGAVFSHPMDQSVSGGNHSTLARLQAVRAAILNRLVPIGYQDEAGFHYGVEDGRSMHGGRRPVQPAGAIVVRERGTAGGQSG